MLPDGRILPDQRPICQYRLSRSPLAAIDRALFPMQHDNRDAVAEDPWRWLDAQRVLNLATTGPEGPWSASVYFARDGRRLLFLSSSRSRHARDLAADPRCAATISGDTRHPARGAGAKAVRRGSG
jgi:hypothetical protein